MVHRLEAFLDQWLISRNPLIPTRTRHLLRNLRQGDPASRRIDHPSQAVVPRRSRLISTSHDKPWEPTGSRATLWWATAQPLGHPMSIGRLQRRLGRWSNSGHTWRALSTWAPLPRPTEPSVLELLKFCLHRSEALFQLRVVVRVCFPAFDQLLSWPINLHLVTSLEIHAAVTISRPIRYFLAEASAVNSQPQVARHSPTLPQNDLIKPTNAGTNNSSSRCLAIWSPKKRPPRSWIAVF